MVSLVTTPCGVSSAPGIFQRNMENLLQNISYVIVRVDDILVSGADDEDHLNNLEEVLKRFAEAGLRFKRSKCVFLQPQVTYLGHKVSKEGIQPMGDKVEAITNAPSPTNVSELKSYLGLINYYQKFLPNLSSLLAPLHLIGCCRRKSVGIGAEKKNKRLKNQSCPEVIKTIGIFRRPKGTDIIL